MRTTDNFQVPVQNVIDGLKDIEIESIVIVARKEDGSLYISSSIHSDKTLDLIRCGKNQIETGEFDE